MSILRIDAALTVALFAVCVAALPIRRAFAGDSSATRPAITPLEVAVVFPGSRSQGHEESQVKPEEGCELLNLKAADGTKIVALFGKPLGEGAGGARPAMTFFYGNGMWMAECMDLVNGFRAQGFNVIIVDYEGYGMSGGTPGEAGCYAAADAAYDYLLTRKDIDQKHIVSCGWSIGAAVAIDLASRRHVAGLVTFSAFTNCDHIAQRVAGSGLAIELNTKFDNANKMGLISCPIFMAHGMKDALVDPKMLDTLAEKARSKPTMFRLPDAGHNDIFFLGGKELLGKVKTFIEGLPESAPAPQK